MKDDRISLATAKLLKAEKSFKEDAGAFYTEYLVNQKDLEYPEGGGPFSMSKGEITFDTGYFVNNNRGYGDFSNKNYVSYGAPTQALLQRWFREKQEIEVYVKPYSIPQLNGKGSIKYYGLVMEIDCVYACNESTNSKNTYEEALDEALQLAFKFIK